MLSSASDSGPRFITDILHNDPEGAAGSLCCTVLSHNRVHDKAIATYQLIQMRFSHKTVCSDETFRF